MDPGVNAQHVLPQMSEEEVVRGITYRWFCWKSVGSSQGQARPSEAEVRDSWVKQVDIESLFNDLDSNFLINQAYSPGAFDFWHTELRSMCCRPHTPYSPGLFYSNRPNDFVGKKNYISMKNQRGQDVKVLDFSLNRICDLQYCEMVGSWFEILNPKKDLTPKLAFNIWAGIAINTFFFASLEDKISMINQANGSASKSYWGSKFVRFDQFPPTPDPAEELETHVPAPDGTATGSEGNKPPSSPSSITSDLSSVTPSPPGSAVEDELRECIAGQYVQGLALSEASTLSSLDSDTPTEPSSSESEDDT